MTIAITGATGQLGRLIVERLKPHAPVALVRSPEKAADLGVEARAFDYGRPETLAPALNGIDTLLLISSSEVGQRVAQHRNVIEAAKAAGVARIVYTSLLHADTSRLEPLAGEHAATEAMLAESGIPHTLLRNGWYFENYAAGIGAAVAHGTLIGSAGAGRIAAATRADYADAAAAVLTGTGHDGKTYELAGDTGFTLAELAAEISRQSGKAISYADLPVTDYAAALTGAGLPEPVAAMIAGWEPAIADGALFDGSGTLGRLIGRPTTSLSAAVAALLG